MVTDTLLTWQIWGRRETHTQFWQGNLKGMRLLERPRCRWEDNIVKDLKEIGWEGMDWITLGQ